MTYKISVAELAEQPIAVVRDQARQSELPTKVPRLCGEAWTFVKTHDLKTTGRMIAVYRAGTEPGHLQIEAETQVLSRFDGDGRVVCSATPGGPAATTVHMGPYAGLGQAHEAVLQWCKQNGRELTGLSWELYGHWTDDPTQLRTDVFWQLR